jgi:hypothetical protein
LGATQAVAKMSTKTERVMRRIASRPSFSPHGQNPFPGRVLLRRDPCLGAALSLSIGDGHARDMGLVRC